MGTAYAGAMLFAPGVFALRRARTREKWFLGGIIVFAFLAGAEAPIVSAILARLPVFSLAINARMISFAAFAICVLAAIGLHASLTERRRLALLFLIIGAIIAALATLLAIQSTL